MSASPASVSDLLSNFNDQIAQAARIVGRSKIRQAIFEFVYKGNKQVKTIEEISKAIRKSPVHVLTEGGKMAGLLLEKVPGGYKKRKELAPHYSRILVLARDKKRLESLPTKVSPKVGISKTEVKITFPSSASDARHITVDDIDSFKLVRNKPVSNRGKKLSEQKIKDAFKKIISEKGTFKDWGGEKSDLYTTRVKFNNKRISVAIAFKGKGTTGKLVPSKMGKNGDQINRLFDEPAQLFIVVYEGQVDPSVISQMEAFAIARAIGGQKIYFCVIDGADLSRLQIAYPECF